MVTYVNKRRKVYLSNIYSSNFYENSMYKHDVTCFIQKYVGIDSLRLNGEVCFQNDDYEITMNSY